VLGQRALAFGAAQVLQAGRDIHVHHVVDRRQVLRRGDLVRRPLPTTFEQTPRATLRGREDDLAFLRDTVAAGSHVVVTGPKGAGKTLLLQHAANTGALSGRVLGDDVGVVWSSERFRTAAHAVRELVQECFEVDADAIVPDGLARRALGDVRALVVLDGVDLPPDEALLLLSAMPRSLFVLSSRRDDLWVAGRRRPLGGLSLEDALLMARDELDDQVDADEVESDWRACDGNPVDVLERAAVRDSARRLSAVPQGVSSAEALAQGVTIVLGSLTDQARDTLRALTALGDVRWGPQLLTAVCGVPEAEGAATLARKRLAHFEDDGYRVGDVVSHFPGTDLVPLVERVTEWVAGVRPDAVAREIDVVERALKRTLDAELHETALALARTASAALGWTRHWVACRDRRRVGARRDLLPLRAGRVPAQRRQHQAGRRGAGRRDEPER
jgi:ABC-type cobalamin/Fe3+-siderophores transport system ATPase subunit